MIYDYVSWHYKTEGTYIANRIKVMELCEKQFGQEHSRTYNNITQKYKDNHGNWKYVKGQLKFRYQKDMMWFLLQAAGLEDPPKAGRWW